MILSMIVRTTRGSFIETGVSDEVTNGNTERSVDKNKRRFASPAPQ